MNQNALDGITTAKFKIHLKASQLLNIKFLKNGTFTKICENKFKFQKYGTK